MKVSVYRQYIRSVHEKELYFRSYKEALEDLISYGPFTQITSIALQGPEQENGFTFTYYFSEVDGGVTKFFEYLKENNLL